MTRVCALCLLPSALDEILEILASKRTPDAPETKFLIIDVIVKMPSGLRFGSSCD